MFERLNSQKSLYSQKRSSSRSISSCSLRSDKWKELKVKPKKSKQITIQSESINQVRKTKLTDFEKVFSSQENHRSCKQRSMSVKFENRSVKMGNLLHKIAEEMLKTKPLRKAIYWSFYIHHFQHELDLPETFFDEDLRFISIL